ncbi:MAG: hypothetical protein IIX90_06230 [Clostridia bacterium]|nr:hypothetical protein [Clostridia bacterium]MBQ1981850.1 hypothetical protein [Clostridia bacterium]
MMVAPLHSKWYEYYTYYIQSLTACQGGFAKKIKQTQIFFMPSEKRVVLRIVKTLFVAEIT